MAAWPCWVPRWSAFTLLTPPAALLSLPILLAARVGLGLGEGVAYPAIFSLYARWVPERERSRAVALLFSGIPREPLRQWVLSVPFALRYLFAVNPAVMGQVLGIVTRAIASHLISAAGYHHDTAQTGAVTLIQRFGSALSLNIHFHMLFLDGAYVTSGERLSFRRVPPPTVAALEKLVHVISQRVGRALERQGILVRDLENSFLAVDTPDGTDFDDLLGHSITYRIALGPHQGRKAFTLQTVPAATDAIDGKLARAAG